MATGVYIIVRFVIIFLDVIMFAMLLRAIFSWFVAGSGETPLTGFLFVVTEPFILPVRALCARFGWFQGLPMDMSFLITTVILSILNVMLSSMV